MRHAGAFAAATRAVRHEGGWLINGRKTFISNTGTDMSFGVTLLARTETERADSKPVYVTFVVEKDIASFPMPFDARTQGGWSLGPVRLDDPLTIEFTSYHTILTDQPGRALHLFVDLLGGRVIHEGRDDVRGDLAGVGVALPSDTTSFLVTDPTTSLGVPGACLTQ